MENLQNRHDLSDKQWLKIEPIITAKIGNWGGSNANDNRLFVNAVFWIIRTGTPWRDLPTQYEKFNTVHRSYKRCCNKKFRNLF
jgi:transposase